MVSFKNGIIKFYKGKDGAARTIYEICFAMNVIALFAFYNVRFVGTATGILMLLASMLLWIGRRNRHVIIPYNTVWYFTFTAFSALSTLWSSYTDASIASYLLRMVVIIAIVTSISIYVNKPEDIERLMKLYIISAVVIIALELSVVPIEDWTKGSLGSNFSSSNPNSVSFVIFCAEMMAFYEFYSKSKKGYILFVIAFIFFIILTSSRKSAFVAIVGPLLFVLLSTYKKGYLFNNIAILALAALIIFYVFTDENAYHAIGRRFVSMFDFLFDNRSQRVDNSLYMRVYYVDLAKKMFAESPIIGKGMGNYARIIEANYDITAVYSHNNYWQILSELGIVGFLIYYSFYFIVIIKLMKNAFVKKSRLSLLFFTFMILLLVLETGLVTYNSKISHDVLAMAFTATYVGEIDGRKYRYIENNNV